MDGRSSAESEAVVHRFMKRWTREIKYYEYILAEVEKTCIDVLTKEGIQAEYKSRVKDSQRLKAKCMRRLRENKGM